MNTFQRSDVIRRALSPEIRAVKEGGDSAPSPEAPEAADDFIHVFQPTFEHPLYGNRLVVFGHRDILGWPKCGLPAAHYGEVPSWVHEFTEMYLWGMDTEFNLSRLFRYTAPNSGEYLNTVAHALTSLVSGCTGGGRVISPDEYAYKVFGWRTP